MTASDRNTFDAHFERHIRESGDDGVHFMPYDLEAGDRPRDFDFSPLDKPLSDTGWQRWFVAVEESADIVGHVDIRGSAIRSGLHRCTLGIGIEKPWRGRGLGLRLMQTAIEFTRDAPGLDWIDLGVFSNNPVAIALYRRLGFIEVGRREDLFRVRGEAITDIMMVLDVAGNKA